MDSNYNLCCCNLYINKIFPKMTITYKESQKCKNLKEWLDNEQEETNKEKND